MAIYRSKFAITANMLAGMFQLPEGVEIERVEFDPNRRITVFFLESGEIVEGITQEPIEGHETPFFDFGEYLEGHDSYKRLAKMAVEVEEDGE